MLLQLATCMEVHILVNIMDIYGPKFIVLTYFKNLKNKEF